MHIVLSDRTRHLIGTRELGLMKATACLVNNSRSAIVDEAAMIKALHDGTIGGAALDVYPIEPLPSGRAKNADAEAGREQSVRIADSFRFSARSVLT